MNCAAEGFRTKSEAQNALVRAAETIKREGHFGGWQALRLHSCNKCGQFHIWKKRPLENAKKKVEKTNVEKEQVNNGNGKAS